MKYTKFIIAPIAVLLVVILSCEKDDICAEGTPTTPQLILRFYDIVDPDETSVVTGLFAQGVDDLGEPVDFVGESAGTTRDSIAIPLRTDANTTTFVLYRDYEIVDDMPEGNPETITVNYDREDVYVSRACGFKTIFNNISFSVETDSDNWIVNSEIVSTNVENQNAAHVKVFH